MSVPLSDQIGAMALVDQLRHREMEIQEHLDLPKRRADVAERIRTYSTASPSTTARSVEDAKRAFSALLSKASQ